MLNTNKTRKARSTIIIGLFLINAIASTNWAGEIVFWGQDLYGAFGNTPSGNDFAAVSASDTHCIAIKSDGSLMSWGLDNYGQVRNTPSGTGFKAASAGSGFSVAVKPDGSLISWGRDDYGQVSNTPAGTGFKDVTAGNSHCVALKSDGSLIAWGNDNYGQVHYTHYAGNDIIAVVAGAYHNVALKSDGSLFSWGYDYSGQVGYTPSGTGFTAIGAGTFHSLAVKSGSLIEWGKDTYGNIPSGNDFISVTAGVSHNVALRSDGSLVAWGSNSYGSVSDTPTGTGFTAVAAGSYYNVAIRGTQTPPPIPGVSIAATDASAGEPSNNGYFTVSRTGDTSSSLLVYYSTSGSTASAGADYTALPGYVYILAGQSSASIPVTVYDDSTVESSETVRLTISSNAAYTIGSPSSATVTITDDDVAPVASTVTITATDASAGEPSNNGSFTVSRTGDTSGSILVHYSTSGSTATSGADYAALPGYVYIYAGQSSASIPVTVYDDSTVESSETVRVTISSNTAYTLGSPYYATVTIADDDVSVPPPPSDGPVITLTAPDASAGEPANDGYFRISRTGDTASSLRVFYSASGTASAGTDYAALYGFVYIFAGQSSVDIYVTVYDDFIAENSETVNLTISSNAAYTIGSPGSATVTIADDDTATQETPVVTITAPDASAGEPSNNGYFTVSRTGDTSGNLLVYYSTGGSTATSGADYAALPGYVYIYAGQYSASIPVTVYNDSIVESSETVRVTISSNAAYTIGSPSYATVTIADDDYQQPSQPVVTITAPDASAGEPSNDGYFTVSRTGDTASNLLVYYSTSGSTASPGADYASLPGYVYIPAGQYSASISVTVYDDSIVESSETVRVTISSNAAYTIGSPSYATVTITDDDVSVPPPPVNNAEQMMTDTLDFFYLSVDQGYLEGVGKNKGFKDKALNSFQTMLETALRLIKERDYNGACSQLSDALSGCDGIGDDYVTGSATSTLEAMIEDVMAELGC